MDNAVIQLQLIDAERQALAERYAASAITDEARRRIERELDLEDARVRHAVESAVGNWEDADPAAAETEAEEPVAETPEAARRKKEGYTKRR